MAARPSLPVKKRLLGEIRSSNTNKKNDGVCFAVRMAIIPLVLLAASLVVLVVSSDKLVQSGERTARRFHISDFVLGVTIIAIGTTLPELATGVVASIHRDFELNWGNIVGSNIANIGFVLALSILVTGRFDISQKFFKPDLLALVVFTVLFIVFGSNGVFSALEGALLIILFVSYLVWLTTSIEHTRSQELKKEFQSETEFGLEWVQPSSFQHRLVRLLNSNTFVLLVSLIGIWLGANGTVLYSSQLAQEFNVSQTIIGFTLVAIGTSLPNILVALSALHYRLTDVFLGSIIGANIATIAMVGGVSMIINPMIIAFEPSLLAYGFWVAITAALFFAAWVHPFITKKTAFFFMLIWLIFLVSMLSQAGL